MYNLIRHSCEVYHLFPYIVLARKSLPYDSRIRIQFRKKGKPFNDQQNRSKVFNDTTPPPEPYFLQELPRSVTPAS